MVWLYCWASTVMSIARIMQQAAAGVATGAVEPIGIDFDGTNDYLSRSSDLVGNADGKTFTFSAWIYLTPDSNNGTSIYSSDVGFRLEVDTNQVPYAARLYLNAFDAKLWISDDDLLQYNTWFHLIISVDLANTANRYVYVNDLPISVSYPRYVNTNITFTSTNHVIANSYEKNNPMKGRLAHVYLDYTYRDLSIEANRRLFITADGKPADGQAALNPILYLPFDDPDDPGRNDGTGGDFTLNGIVARSGRGPNQYNAAASTFDGSADYMSRTSLSGIADGKVFTAAFSVSQDTFTSPETYQYVFGIKQSGSVRFGIRFDTAGNLHIFGANSGGSTRLYILIGRANMKYATNKYIHIAMSVDLTDTAKRWVAINGQTVSFSPADYQNDDLDFTTNEYAVGSRDSSGERLDGELSDFWFDTTYIDLSTNNPFYDIETDKPKFLGESGELPTGSAPLIYLPLWANDSGNNKGTGGNFTVSSGPYTGARGPSEFWSGSGNSTSGANYLRNTSLSGGGTSVSQLTVVMAYNVTSSSSTLIQINGNASSSRIFIKPVHNTGYRISMTDTAGFDVIESTATTPLVENVWHTLLMSFDVTNTSKRHVYLNNQDAGFVYEKYFTSRRLEIGSTTTTVLLGNGSGTPAYGRMGFLWFDTTYIDFSQEANRLKFFDALGYPVDLGADGSLPTGNQPLIYMNKDFHLGTNYGSGGNFTPVGTPTDGGYVKG